MPAAAADPAIPEVVRQAWEHVLEGWDEPARHDRLLGLAAQHDCFAWVAARYREKPGDTIADARLDRLRRAATAKMMATGTPRPDPRVKPYTLTIALMIALVTVAIVGFLYAIHLKRPSAPLPPKAATPAGPQHPAH